MNVEPELPSRRKTKNLLQWFAAVSALALGVLSLGMPLHACADDLDVFKSKVCTTGTKQHYRFIFIVDNSGSMSTSEFVQSKKTIDSSIEYVLENVENVEVAVVQYGSAGGWSKIHTYDVTVPFTSDEKKATKWQRAYGRGGKVNRFYYQDHQPASLARMRLDNVYASGGALDITDGNNVQFVFFTDAWRDFAWGCCSSLVADTRSFIPNYVLPGFGEYDAIKNGSVLPRGIKGQFTVLSSNGGSEHLAAAAAISSVGGSFTGAVESVPSDPDGPGALPRRFVSGSLSASDTTQILSMLDDVFKEIVVPPATQTDSFTQASIDLDRAILGSDERAYFALFAPSDNRAWRGNLKGYHRDKNGFKDLNGRMAFVTDSEGGTTIAPGAHSFWSGSADGADVLAGGANEQIRARRRNLYTWLGNTRFLTNWTNRMATWNPYISPSMLGVATQSQKWVSLNWLQSAPMGDALHSKPQLVRYDGRNVLFAMTNQGLMHAFDATRPYTESDRHGGEELWAFMPRELMTNLPLLSGTPTVGDHIYGLDGHITLWHDDHNSDGKVNGRDTALLIFGQRRGGANYYALDITNPRSPTMAWHIQGGVTSGFDGLAQTWSRPALIRVKRSGTSETPYSAQDTDRVLVFSGGYDDELDGTGAHTRASGGGIYMIDRKGAIIWSTERDLDFAMPADLTPLDVDGDGLADRIYAADMGGQIWRVDFDDIRNSSGFSMAKFAKLDNGDYQPFFYPVDVSLLQEGTRNYLGVTIGSGDRDNPLGTDSRNRLFMLKDYDVEKGKPPEVRPVIRLSNLYDVSDFKLGSSDADVREQAAADLRESKGWYLNLQPGEKSLSGVSTIDGKLLATTFTPVFDGDPAECTTEYSTLSSLYVLDPRNGSPVQNLSDASSETEEELTVDDRRIDLGGKGIPSAPLPVFSQGTEDIQIIVDKSIATELSTTVTTVHWYEE